jgi:predicted pyridoxine 5'-phosphate oxidase superfamily flavin-nucleotide-binding protein
MYYGFQVVKTVQMRRRIVKEHTNKKISHPMRNILLEEMRELSSEKH